MEGPALPPASGPRNGLGGAGLRHRRRGGGRKLRKASDSTDGNWVGFPVAASGI